MVRFSYYTRILIVAAYMIAHAGFPVIGIHPIRHGGSYPCERHGCGCTSAEHCWKNCCCMSSVERLAWAERNAVTPPVELSQAIAARSDDLQPRQNGHTCCAAGECNSEQASQATDLAKKWHLVSAIQAMKCRGHNTYWSAVSEPALATTAAMLWQFQPHEAGSIVAMSHSLESWSTTPPVPPG